MKITLMNKSIQDQLLALGVADKKKVKQAKHQERLKSRGPAEPSIQESLKATQQNARDEKKARDKLLAADRDAVRVKAEKLAQLRDMVKANSVDRGHDASRVDFRYPYGKKIRPFPVSTEVRDGLARGLLGLIEIDRAICIIPRDVLERCLERLDGQKIFSHLAKLEVLDDDYPPIPDDLDW